MVSQSDHRSNGDKALGNLLRDGRLAAGLSKRALAEKLAVSRPYLSRLERGEYNHPAPPILARISKCLDIRIEDLYAIVGYMVPSDLPNFEPYVRAKHPNWPDGAIRELESFYDYLKHKYSQE
jgi:transcriptional regulator with XRE-family HTH domain